MSLGRAGGICVVLLSSSCSFSSPTSGPGLLSSSSPATPWDEVMWTGKQSSSSSFSTMPCSAG